MSCLKCKERAQLIQEALVAYRAGDMEGYRNKMQAVATSLGLDVKVLATTVVAKWTKQQ